MIFQMRKYMLIVVLALIKEENKVVKMGMSVGESVSADQNGNEYQQRTYAILERIDAINSEQQAIRSVIKTRKEEFDLMDREAQLTSEQIDLGKSSHWRTFGRS